MGVRVGWSVGAPHTHILLFLSLIFPQLFPLSVACPVAPYLPPQPSLSLPPFVCRLPHSRTIYFSNRLHIEIDTKSTA